MFIALQQQYVCAPEERHVLWAFRLQGYKHIAPVEQVHGVNCRSVVKCLL